MVCQNFIQKLKSCPPGVTASGCIFLSLIIGKGFSGVHPLLTSTTALTPKFEFTLGASKAKYLTTNQAIEPVFITSASSSAHHKAFTSSTSTNKKRIPHTKIITTTPTQVDNLHALHPLSLHHLITHCSQLPPRGAQAAAAFTIL